MTATTQLTIPVTVTWTERNVIPPRCRNARDIERELDVEVTVPVTTSDQAPVAFIVTDEKYDMGQGGYVPVTHEIRTWDGKLWRPLTDNVDGVISPRLATPESIVSRAFYFGWRGAPHLAGGSPAEVRANAQAEVADFLSIDGHLWALADEPVYEVRDTGRASYGVRVSHAGLHQHNDGHAMDSNIFAADKRDDAIAYMLAITEALGKTGVVDSGRAVVGTIEVTGAFTPGSTFTPAPALAYMDPWRAREAEQWGGKPGTVAPAVAEFRQALLKVPGAVEDVPDGWGGTTKRVISTALTKKQWDDYQHYTKLETELGLR